MRVLRWQRRAFGLAAALALALPATGCMTTEQTAAQASSSLPASDLAAIRYFADSPPSDLVPKRRAGDRHTVLALSGGGPDGAYGVGALAGWSNAGTRPAFDVVTGVSTGALMAP
ncbi:MAG: patatin-like phospholipase family protein, partial [Methylobacterium sp.]|nr:patatin-like phospholipase family protein [Methylobacterium sp.]